MVAEHISIMGKLEDCGGEDTSFGLCARQHLCWVKCSYAKRQCKIMYHLGSILKMWRVGVWCCQGGKIPLIFRRVADSMVNHTKIGWRTIYGDLYWFFHISNGIKFSLHTVFGIRFFPKIFSFVLSWKTMTIYMDNIQRRYPVCVVDSTVPL